MKKLLQSALYSGCVGSSLLLSLPTQANNTQLFFEIRERMEHQEGLNDKFYGDAPKVGEASDTYLLSRIRLGLMHQFNDQWQAKASIQDSRVFDWGFSNTDWANSEFGGIENNPQHDPLELGETYVEYQNPFGFKAKVGRQSIHYGNKRVFGPGAWKNSGKWVWDAAKFSYKSGKNWVDAFYGKTLLHDPESFSLDHRHGYIGSGIYGHLQATDSLIVEPMLITKYNDDSLDYDKKDLFYAGARALYKAYGWKVDATYIKQMGEIVKLTGAKQDVEAEGHNLDISYRFNPKWLIATTYAYASGDDKSTGDVNERFDGVYGAADKYYGRMNLMGWANLVDYGAFINYRPNRAWELQLEAHQFFADEVADSWKAYKATNPLKTTSSHYGNEIDFTADYRVNKQVKVMAGVGYFMPGNAIQESVENGTKFLTDDQAWSGFLQISYQFSEGKWPFAPDLALKSTPNKPANTPSL